MNETPAQHALTASTLALVAALTCIALFLPPLSGHVIGSLLLTVTVGLVIAVAIPLHWVFLGIAARRMERSAPGWVALSVLLFPVGGATALILLSWFGDERHAAPAPTPHHG